MATIVRDLRKAAEDTFDLVIIGGGIYGAMLALESSRRGLHPLLVERDDFGEHTSANSLRIIHGGLRYLQSLRFRRHRESAGERHWFLTNLPGLVTPLPCLMPLYGSGLRRPSVFRFGVYADRLLSYRRDPDEVPNQHLPSGRVITAQQTRQAFPSLDPQGLRGGAIWHDAFAQDTQRLLIEILRWASKNGSTLLNYLEADRLNVLKGRVVGVVAIDRETGVKYEFRTNLVVNAAGPWSRSVSSRFNSEHRGLFNPALAWNLLLNRKPLSTYALAISPRRRGGRTYFMVPCREKIFVGTGHTSWKKPVAKRPLPTRKQIQQMLDDLNAAVPGLCLQMNEILRITPGLVPTSQVGGWEPATSAIYVNHATAGGIQGLHSLSGVKLTTARYVAASALNRIFPSTKRFGFGGHRSSSTPRQIWSERPVLDEQLPLDPTDKDWQTQIRSIVEEESVLHLDDLILRRLPFGDIPSRALEYAPVICQMLGWDTQRTGRELQRLKNAILTNEMLEAD